MNFPRLTPAVLTLLALGAIGLLVGPGARAEDAAATGQAPATWVYDVRVVRVDPAVPAVLEVAPKWQPAGAGGATTTAAWADLLGDLKARGRTTMLLDQRLTAIGGVATDFKQEQKRPVLMLAARTDKMESWTTQSVETGTNGDLLVTRDGLYLTYRIDVRWEERPTSNGMASLGSASWKGSHSNFKAGETLVLSYRQQQAEGEGARQGLEIYAFVTGWPVSAK